VAGGAMDTVDTDMAGAADIGAGEDIAASPSAWDILDMGMDTPATAGDTPAMDMVTAGEIIIGLTAPMDMDTGIPLITLMDTLLTGMAWDMVTVILRYIAMDMAALSATLPMPH